MPKYYIPAAQLRERFGHDNLRAQLVYGPDDNGMGNVWFVEFSDGHKINTHFAAFPDPAGFSYETMLDIICDREV